jgi:hypothetical protein
MEKRYKLLSQDQFVSLKINVINDNLSLQKSSNKNSTFRKQFSWFSH